MTIEQQALALEFDALSFDAKCIAGAWFGLMLPGKGKLTFQLQNVRPSERALTALADLVAHGFVSVEAFNRYGGLVYRPLKDCTIGHQFLGENLSNPAIKWPITQQITGGDKEARAVQKAALAKHGLQITGVEP